LTHYAIMTFFVPHKSQPIFSLYPYHGKIQIKKLHRCPSQHAFLTGKWTIYPWANLSFYALIHPLVHQRNHLLLVQSPSSSTSIKKNTRAIKIIHNLLKNSFLSSSPQSCLRWPFTLKHLFFIPTTISCPPLHTVQHT
jgi:hypothetical protein